MADASAPDIQVFATGGTIDKVYFDAQSAYEIGEPQTDDIFEQAGVTFGYRLTTLLSKDSLDLTDADREHIADAIVRCDAVRVIVTHGTDTMAETARVVAHALAEANVAKTVVFVGSLTPALFKHSDAEFNVGFAAGAVQALPPGAYIAMSGRIFDPFRVRKNRAANRFEAVDAASDPPLPGANNAAALR